MTDNTAGKCDIPKPRVYRDGVIQRCSFDFGHGGKHSWEVNYTSAGWTNTQRPFEEAGKLTDSEAEYLQDGED